MKQNEQQGYLKGEPSGHDLKEGFQIACYSWESYCQHYHLKWLRIQEIKSFSSIPR